MPRCIFDPNLEILTTIRGDLWRGQTHKLKLGQILTLKLKLTLKVNVNQPQNNRDRNQGLLHLRSKFGDGQSQATTIPEGQKLASGKNVILQSGGKAIDVQ